MKRLSLLVILFMIISGMIATSSSMNPMSETVFGWYDPVTGQVHCWEKWTCLHESVHEYDWENESGYQISTTKRFHKAVTEYREKVYGIPEEDRTFFESYIYDFPEMGNTIKEDGWGEHVELFAMLFEITELHGLEMPAEFIQFYDNGVIYKLWKPYPNFWSRL